MIDMKTLADRIRSEREARGMTQPQLGAHAGVTKQAISAIEKGLSQQPKHETLVALASVLGVSAQWLMTGREPKHGTDTIKVAEGAVAPGYVAASEPAPGYVRFPLLAMEGEMGFGTYSDDAIEVVQFLDVADWWAKQNLPARFNRVKIISARGDSMAGVINHGDVVFVDVGVDHYDGEGIYVFNWQGRALIKRLAPNLRTGHLQIMSANPAYPAEDVAVGEVEQLHIAGRVVAWWTLRNH